MDEPECHCQRCWLRNHPDDPGGWPNSESPDGWTDGTIRVAVRCLVNVAPYMVNPGVEVESHCEFFGHTMAEAEAKARRHLKAGPWTCAVARKHSTDLLFPEGVRS